ncbi:AraC family transcriptional regulator [Enterococcus sp. 2201sp1_2201st1_B8_2201SCRN_220225]|uniref:helix-turn-helix transcriptional regulator n=1 Tax=unclassified Enterococcus TaxID=2608891 RepID=UPI0034A42B88
MNPIFLKELAVHGDDHFNFSLYSLSYHDNRTTLVHNHWHDEMEFLFIEKGNALLKMKDYNLPLTENTLIFLPGKVAHKVINTSDEEKIIYSFVFGEELIRIPGNQQSFFNLSELNTLQMAILDQSANQEILKIIYQIIDVYIEHKSGTEFLIRGNLFLMFYYLFQQLETTKIPRLVKEDTLDYRFKCLIDYVRKNYQETITLDDAAQLLNLHPGYFCKLFKKEFGCTFSTYVRRYRLSKAKLLLRTTQLSIIDIGYACGFTSNQYFSTAFTKEFQLSPSNYRKKYHLTKRAIS